MIRLEALADKHNRAALALVIDSRYRRRTSYWTCPGMPNLSHGRVRELIAAGLAFTYASKFGTTFLKVTDAGLQAMRDLQATKRIRARA